ncbi:hypothetical protein ABZ942_26015 [Nocardia sp. NPDC046473]|uniref:hypothetical protein n=1 Tax=Nocardia sp. NPDC046473 TaxID=3155733 RepID=UPI0033D343C5
MGDPKDDWKGFKRPGALKLTDDVAKQAATYCADMLDVIDLVAADVSRVVPTQPEMFGHLLSGHQLTDEFVKAGKRFRDEVLDSHKKILTDMAQSFLIAGNHYKNADEQSQTDLDAIKNSREPREGIVRVGQSWQVVLCTTKGDVYGWADTPVHDPSNYQRATPDDKGNWQVGKYGGLPSGLQATDKGAAISAEPAVSLIYEDFNKLFSSLGGVYAARDVSQGWNIMAGKLDAGFTDFNANISGLVDSEKWTGYGAESAKNAVHVYTATGKALVQTMYNMGTISLDAYNWGKTTQVNMPSQPAASMSDRNKILELGLARAAYGGWYEQGMAATSAAIPTIPLPQGPKPLQNNSTPGTPGPPGPPGAPGKASPGAPGLQNQQQQEEQQRKLQQQADEQRKALEDQQRRAQEQQDQREKLQQQQEQQRATQQAAQQASQQATQMASQIGQQLSQAAQQMGSQLATAAQQAAQQAGLAGLPTLPSMKDLEEQAKKALGTASAKGAGGPGPGSAAKLGGVGQTLDKAAKLFPRAEATTNAAATGARAGLASSAGMGMGPGPGPGAQGQQKEHKRADYLDSTEHLEDAIGEAPVVVKPIVEQ